MPVGARYGGRVRAVGVLDEVGQLGAHDHVCWVYDDQRELAGHVARFLLEGLDLGQRVAWFARGDVRRRRRDLAAAHPRLAEALGRGGALVDSVDRTYGRDATVTPWAQVWAYATAVEEALDDGYAGLRVAADGTDLVATAGQRAAFARYEHLVDRYMTTRPFSAMCCYDRTALGDDAVAELSCLHPLTNAADPGVGLHAVADGTIAVRGSLTAATAPSLRRALVQLVPPPPGAPLVVDVDRVAEVDVDGVATLAAEAARRDVDLVLRGGDDRLVALVATLGRPDVRTEPLA